MSAMDEARTAVEFLARFVEPAEPEPGIIAEAQAYALLAIAEELRTANIIAYETVRHDPEAVIPTAVLQSIWERL